MEKETLYRYVACQASPEEETAVLTWLEADPAHESELAKVQRQHDLVALSAPVINELYAKDRRRRFGSVLRRWSAAAAAVPAVTQDYDDRSMAEMALVENLQREDLNPVDEGLAYQKLMDDYGLTQEDISRKVGKSRPYVANMVRLLALPEEVRNFLSKGQLTAGQARPLLGLGSDAEKVQLARRIVKEGLSARRVEEIIRQGRESKPKDNPPPAETFMKAVEEKLGLSVGSKVRIRIGKGKNAHKGTISISFSNDEEFQRIADILNQNHKSR